jgi:hypothetical protein
MKFPPQNYFLICFAATALFLSASCNNSNPNNSSAQANNVNAATGNSNLPKDDSAELEMIVKLPEQPEDVAWREEETSKGKKLTAVLKYSAENAAKIIASAEKNKPPEQTEIDTETWFPEELTAQSQLSGNETLKGTAYGANDFLNAPYVQGKLIRIQDTNYFVLELTAF